MGALKRVTARAELEGRLRSTIEENGLRFDGYGDMDADPLVDALMKELVDEKYGKLPEGLLIFEGKVYRVPKAVIVPDPDLDEGEYYVGIIREARG